MPDLTSQTFSRTLFPSLILAFNMRFKPGLNIYDNSTCLQVVLDLALTYFLWCLVGNGNWVDLSGSSPGDFGKNYIVTSVKRPEIIRVRWTIRYSIVFEILCELYSFFLFQEKISLADLRGKVKRNFAGASNRIFVNLVQNFDPSMNLNSRNQTNNVLTKQDIKCITKFKTYDFRC